MKQKTCFLIFTLCLFLLTACGGTSTPSPGSTSSNPTIENDSHKETQTAGMTESFRIVAAEGPGHPPLLLAKVGGGAGDVYVLSDAQNIPVTLEWVTEDEMAAIDWSYLSGSLVEITHDGTLLETYPLQFGEIFAIHIPEYGFDDRCALYLKVLEDLWEVDSGLSGGVEVIGVDLSETSLSLAERAAVAWDFANRHNAEPVEGTLDDLISRGYVTGEPLGTEDAPSDAKFWHWENGCHFSITEQPMEGTYSLVPVTFDAMKWRSSLGAYWFCDCTAVQSALGEWSDYQIGSEMIS